MRHHTEHDLERDRDGDGRPVRAVLEDRRAVTGLSPEIRAYQSGMSVRGPNQVENSMIGKNSDGTL